MTILFRRNDAEISGAHTPPGGLGVVNFSELKRVQFMRFDVSKVHKIYFFGQSG
jgi:hypothetical protein